MDMSQLTALSRKVVYKKAYEVFKTS